MMCTLATSSAVCMLMSADYTAIIAPCSITNLQNNFNGFEYKVLYCWHLCLQRPVRFQNTILEVGHPKSQIKVELRQRD